MQSPPDPIRDVLTKLVTTLDQLPDSAKPLATKIRELDKDAQDPVRFNQKSVQHEVAYAGQDFEKATGRQLDLTPAQRTEVTKLAGSAPGLENERLAALLRSTGQFDDSALIGRFGGMRRRSDRKAIKIPLTFSHASKTTKTECVRRRAPRSQ